VVVIMLLGLLQPAMVVVIMARSRLEAASVAADKAVVVDV